jgi:hypothetical protein
MYSNCTRPFFPLYIGLGLFKHGGYFKNHQNDSTWPHDIITYNNKSNGDAKKTIWHPNSKQSHIGGYKWDIIDSSFTCLQVGNGDAGPQVVVMWRKNTTQGIIQNHMIHMSFSLGVR